MIRIESDGNIGYYQMPQTRLPQIEAPHDQAYLSQAGLPQIEAPHDQAILGGPYEADTSISRVGPTVSVQPRANLDPNLRAGSLLSGGFPTRANYRAGKGAAIQRAFTVEMQERLRRRRRNRFTGYA